MSEAVRGKQGSHNHQHMTRVHPEIDKSEYYQFCRFEVQQKHTSAFRRQLHEVVALKRAPCIVLNLRDEYTRCCTPDVPLDTKRWPEDGVIPDYAKTTDTPRKKSPPEKPENEVENGGRLRLSKRMVMISFKRIKRKKNKLNFSLK